MWDTVHHDYSNWDSAPNSGLVYQNSLFDMIRGDEPVTLAHVTLSLDAIIAEGSIYPSAGCLVGSVYCTPAFRDGSRLRLHNLGAYYYLREARQSGFTRGVGGAAGPVAAEPRILLIEVSRPKDVGRALEGVNYLRMGDLHFKCFEEYADLAPDDIKDIAVSSILAEEGFLVRTVEEIRRASTRVDQDLDYLEEASRAVRRGQMPYFGYALFEAFCTALMLLQDDEASVKLRELGEFNNWHYKELLYRTFPAFQQNFRLSGFSPNWRELIAIIHQEGIVGNNTDRLVSVIATRVRRYLAHNSLVNFREFNGFRSGRRVADWGDVVEHARPLVGHTIHRVIRNVDPETYFDLFNYFEQTKAQGIWAYWVKKRIAFPFNGVLPKGEMGINPAMKALQLRYYEAEVEVEGDHVYVRPTTELKLQMKRRLGSLQHSFMRDKSGILPLPTAPVAAA